MVTYVLKSRTDNRLVYEYYPKGDTEKLPGLISVWMKKRNIALDIAAEADFIVFSTSEEIRELKDSIDEVYMELDMIPESDEEWESIVEAYDWYYYAEKVIDELSRCIYYGNFYNAGKIEW